jgi:hypothetical protein
MMIAIRGLIGSIAVSMIFSICSIAATPAEDKAALKRLCAKVLCRGKSHVALNMGQGKTIEQDFDEFNPVVMGSDITVLPGETLFIEAEERAGRLENLKAVISVRDPARTLIIKFKQEKSSVNMVLRVVSPFSRPLKYSLSMIVPGQQGAVQTSSCPAMPKRPAIEQWPHPIFQLMIRNPMLLAKDTKDLACK